MLHCTSLFNASHGLHQHPRVWLEDEQAAGGVHVLLLFYLYCLLPVLWIRVVALCSGCESIEEIFFQLLWRWSILWKLLKASLIRSLTSPCDISQKALLYQQWLQSICVAQPQLTKLFRETLKTGKNYLFSQISPTHTLLSMYLGLTISLSVVEDSEQIVLF